MLPDRARTLLDKIISDAETGEKAPFRAFAVPRLRPYLAPEDAVWKLGAGSVILCGCALRSLHRALHAAFTMAAQPTPEENEKTAAGDEKDAGGKEKKAAKKPPAKKSPTAADKGEQLAIAALGVTIAGAVTTMAIAAIGPRLTPYLPAAIPVWIITAIAIAPDKPRKKTKEETAGQAPEASDEELHERDRLTLLVILETLTRHRNGVHLDELHETLTTHPLFKGLQRVHTSALLKGLGVPFQRTLSVDGIEGRSGVRRADVEALLLALPQKGQEAPSQPSESGSDQQESRSLPDDSRAPLGPLSDAAQGVV